MNISTPIARFSCIRKWSLFFLRKTIQTLKLQIIGFVLAFNEKQVTFEPDVCFISFNIFMSIYACCIMSFLIIVFLLFWVVKIFSVREFELLAFLLNFKTLLFLLSATYNSNVTLNNKKNNTEKNPFIGMI